MPLFRTFKLATPSNSLQVVPGAAARPCDFDVDLTQRLSIIVVHLPLVPDDVGDTTSWQALVTVPAHRAALESRALREWLHFLAHTKVQGKQVLVPADLRTHDIFRLSAAQAEQVLGSPTFSYSEKEMADYQLEAERMLEAERAARKAEVETERAAREAAAAEVETERAARKAEVEALMAEVSRLKGGSR
jgi:hypothetical protein